MKDIYANKPFMFILFTAFLSVLGIGIIIPVIPFLVAKNAPFASQSQVALYVGLLISVYSIAQFFAAPGLGALSDRFGRRPILLLCLFGSAIGYLLFGIGGSLFVLFLGRIIDGFTGGDISTVFAYIADITKPEDRGRYFGVIGGVVGVGFMIGPTIGGLLSLINLSAPFYFAAGITLVNMLFGYFVLPESLQTKHRMLDLSIHHLNPFAQLYAVLSNTLIRTVLFIGFFYFLPFAQLQGIGSVFAKDVMHWRPLNIGFYFLVIGSIDIVTQGFLSGKLLKRFGEIKLVLAGLFVTGLAYGTNALLPLNPSTIQAYIGVVLFAFGSGLIEPSLGSLISRSASPREQGRVQGANQSLQSITRIIGPLIASILYGYGVSLPYITCVLLSAIAIMYVLQKKKSLLHFAIAADK